MRSWCVFVCALTDGMFGRCHSVPLSEVYTYDVSPSVVQHFRMLLEKLSNRGTHTHTHTHLLFYLWLRPQFVFILSRCDVPSSPSLTTRGRQRPVQHFTGTCGRFMRLHHSAQPHTLPEFIFLCLASGEKTCFLLTSSCSVPICRNITTINKQTNKQRPPHPPTAPLL